jgi:uncharacterized iron-regulated membrane protein
MYNFLRRWHKKVAIITALPVTITIVTGLFLILRSHFVWIQPSKTKKIEVEFSSIATIEQVIQKSADYYGNSFHPNQISSLRYAPSKGYFSIRMKNLRELRLHGETLKVLSEGNKKTPLFIQLHEGSYFGPRVRDFIFFPSALGLLFLLFSGSWLFIHPYLKKRQKRASL